METNEEKLSSRQRGRGHQCVTTASLKNTFFSDLHEELPLDRVRKGIHAERVLNRRNIVPEREPETIGAVLERPGRKHET